MLGIFLVLILILAVLLFGASAVKRGAVNSFGIIALIVILTITIGFIREITNQQWMYIIFGVLSIAIISSIFWLYIKKDKMREAKEAEKHRNALAIIERKQELWSQIELLESQGKSSLLSIVMHLGERITVEQRSKAFREAAQSQYGLEMLVREFCSQNDLKLERNFNLFTATYADGSHFPSIEQIFANSSDITKEET